MNRLSQLPTLRVDSGTEVPFTYRGIRYRGLAGDTIATALFSQGVRIFGRSLKYHRPRGLYSMDGECSNTCMEVDGVPNVRAETTRLREGMAVKAQNVFGGCPERDFLGILDRMGWAMPAGFYYHTMHKPAALWPFFRKIVRAMAGLGKLNPSFTMKGTYDQLFPHTDVCVVGGGPAGMSAALAAASFGLRTILLESRPVLGGFFDYREARYEPGKALYQRGRDLAALVSENPSIRVFTGTSMVGAYNNNLITAFQAGGAGDPFDERYLEIRASSVVFATGCVERPLVFEHNERPGVMQVGCAHRLARTYGLLPGADAVFSVGHDLGLEAAADLSDLGVTVHGVADCRTEGHDAGAVEALAHRKIPFFPGWAALEAHGSKCVTGGNARHRPGDRTEEFRLRSVGGPPRDLPRCRGRSFSSRPRPPTMSTRGCSCPRNCLPESDWPGASWGFPILVQSRRRAGSQGCRRPCTARRPPRRMNATAGKRSPDFRVPQRDPRSWGLGWAEPRASSVSTKIPPSSM